jgi:hypothetical protein
MDVNLLDKEANRKQKIISYETDYLFLLRWDTASLGEQKPAFRNNVLSLFSFVETSKIRDAITRWRGIITLKNVTISYKFADTSKQARKKLTSINNS